MGVAMSVRKWRGGRPRKSADLRDVTVSCRLTQAEWQYLSDLALNEGLSLNDLLRLLLLGGMPRESNG
jgi:predicted DNA-binding ribbon-helix-helix protein